MADVVIRFDEISKRYRLRRGWYRSIREELREWAQRIVTGSGRRDVFWALKNVSFDVEQGDVVGLIGPNGAGKSTILKILSRVTVPTSGRFALRGRVGALIEIGAGFHPDLTGRENVYLNGAIMGMRRQEIDAKFDRIVSFAEVETFVDTPVKHYSSGMQVRLGFSVAAHTDPDILLIDEVLAVGDASFQIRCLNRLAELKEQGKTIILVSHNMANVLQHSRKVLWIEGGEIRGYGWPDAVVERYLASVRDRMHASATSVFSSSDADQPIRVDRVSLCDVEGRVPEKFRHGDAVCIDISFTVRQPIHNPVFEVTIQDAHGYPLGGITSRFGGLKIDSTVEQGVVRLMLRPVLFLKGDYVINVHIRDQFIERYYDVKKRAAVLIVDGPSIASREVSGHLVYPHEWQVRL